MKNVMINKLKWAIDRGCLWSRSAININAVDRFLVSFPKAGSTWVRYFLCETLCQRSSEVNTSMDVTNKLMPEFAHRSLFLPWKFEKCARIIKTHQKYNVFFRGNSAALIVRDPRDIAISFYHYAKGSKKYNFEGSVSDIIRHPRMGLKAFLSHYQSWVTRADLILKYEAIKESPFEQFAELLEFYGVQRTEDEIRSAIAASNFSAMKKAQASSVALNAEFKEGHQFVRSGKSAQWKEYFTEEDNNLYKGLKSKYNFDLYE